MNKKSTPSKPIPSKKPSPSKKPIEKPSKIGRTEGYNVPPPPKGTSRTQK